MKYIGKDKPISFTISPAREKEFYSLLFEIANLILADKNIPPKTIKNLLSLFQTSSYDVASELSTVQEKTKEVLSDPLLKK